MGKFIRSKYRIVVAFLTLASFSPLASASYWDWSTGGSDCVAYKSFEAAPTSQGFIRAESNTAGIACPLFSETSGGGPYEVFVNLRLSTDSNDRFCGLIGYNADGSNNESKFVWIGREETLAELRILGGVRGDSRILYCVLRKGDLLTSYRYKQDDD